MKKATGVFLIFAACLLTGFQQTVIAQEKSNPQKDLKNTIHFNLTNPLIFGSSFIVGYERVINKRQTFTVNFGTTGFPSLNLINSDSLKANTIRDDKGYHFSADYRFYLAKENKYSAPRGVYIGPYYSYNFFDKGHVWTVKSTSGGSPAQVNSDLRLNIHTIGFELGYQFIFWRRLSLDMILVGPGVAAYSLKASIGTSLSQADKEKFFQALNDALAEKFPGFGHVIDEGEFKKTGTSKTTSFGYRYVIQIGFRF